MIFLGKPVPTFPDHALSSGGGRAILAGVDGLAELAEHFPGLVQHRIGLLVKTLDQLAHRNHGRQQFAAIFVARQPAQKGLGLVERTVDGTDTEVSDVYDVSDAFAVAGQ